MKKSTITNQWLYSFLLLIMAMVVPRQAYAGAHFNTAKLQQPFRLSAPAVLKSAPDFAPLWANAPVKRAL